MNIVIPFYRQFSRNFPEKFSECERIETEFEEKMGEHAFQNQEESLAQTIFPAKFQESKRLRTYEPFPGPASVKRANKTFIESFHTN